MKKIEKKCWSEYFNKIKSGDKTFEVRLADWKCNIGDILVLKEWDPGKNKFTGRVIEKKITYVAKTKDFKFFTEEEVKKYGFQIIGFK
jgi:ASC-1-like (ASCH) protein